MLTAPIGSLHTFNKRPIRSFLSSFHVFIAISNNSPSGISPSKNGNNIFDLYSSSLNGIVKEIACLSSLFKYSLSYLKIKVSSFSIINPHLISSKNYPTATHYQ